MFLVSGGSMIAGLLLLFGMSLPGQSLIAALSLFLALNFLAAVVRRRPRVEITPEGFTVYKLFGQESRRWDEIHGEFVVIPVGWTKAVGYKINPATAGQTSRKPAAALQGNDAGISGAFALSPEALADLLNSSARQVAGSQRV